MDLHEAYSFLIRHANAPQIEVETKADPEALERLRTRVEKTWSDFGKEDPHWSVITDEKFRSSEIAENLDEFYTTGEHDIARLDFALQRAGVSLKEIGSAMDFGCGVGRLTAALARRVPDVLGVDISANHLREADVQFARLGLANARTQRVGVIEEIMALPQTDLVFSLIVLQHNPPPIMREILAALCTRVKPGGYIYVQLPTYRTGYSYHIRKDLKQKDNVMEMHVLPQRVVYEIFDAAGFRLLEVSEDDATGDPAFKSQVFLACRAGEPRAQAEPEPHIPAEPERRTGLFGGLFPGKKG